MFINYNYMFIWIYRVKRNVDILLLVYIFTWMIQCTHYTASLYVTGVLKLFQVMEIKTHCFVGFCVKVRLLLDFYFDRSGIRVFWLILFCLSFLRSSFFIYCFPSPFPAYYMYTLLFQHNIETFVIEFQIKFEMLFKGINIEYIATYPVVMK